MKEKAYPPVKANASMDGFHEATFGVTVCFRIVELKKRDPMGPPQRSGHPENLTSKFPFRVEYLCS
jgi:hypothetical protein